METGNQPKATRAVEVKNPQGLHLRPGEAFARTASEFESTIEVISGDRRVDGKSLLDIATSVSYTHLTLPTNREV